MVSKLRSFRSALGALVFLVAAFGSLAAPSDGEDWPQFLGPRANGISSETGLLDRWPTNGPPMLWAKQVGTGYSAPSVRGNLLVLHHRLSGDEVVEGLDATNGLRLWRHSYPSAFTDPYGYNNGPRCTPLLTSNRCYTFGAEGKLRCLELQTGRIVWQRDTGKDWQVPAPFFGVGSSPILEDDRLIVMVGGQPNSGVVAFDARTGATLWENVGRTNWDGMTKLGWRGEPKVNWASEDKQASYATPVAATIHGRRHILCLMRQGLVSLDPKTGEIRFSYWFRSPVPESVNAMNPVVQDDLILISAAYYKIGAVLLRVKPDGRGVEEVRRDESLEIHWTTPIVHDGFVYAFSGRNEPDANFRCVNFKTGEIAWQRSERWIAHSARQPDVFGRGSAILADGKLIVLGEGGLLGLFQATPKAIEEISRWQVAMLHYPCWAAPVLSRKRLYLRSEDRLVCFNLAK